MGKTILLSLTLVVLMLSSSCRKYEEQNFDVTVVGAVYDSIHNGVPNVTLYIKRGTAVDLGSPTYFTYDSILTNASGRYQYVVVHERNLMKEICCQAPTGFSVVNDPCTYIDTHIQNEVTVMDTINFIVQR